ADDRQNAALTDDVHVLDLAEPQFPVERGADDRFGAIGLVLRNGKTDRMLGPTLGNQDHGDAVLAKRAKQTLRRAWHANHASPFDVDERGSIDGRDPLDRV